MKTLVQISDCHLFADKHKVGYQQIKPYFSLAAVLEEVVCHDPDMILVTGDISADGSEQSYLDFLALITRFELLDKLQVIAGNHDNSLWFDRVLGEFDLATQSAKELENWSVHGVDTRHKGTLGQLSNSQLNKLKLGLQDCQSAFQLVACHHHPFACGGWMDKHEWLNRQEFTDIITQYTSVKAVVYGHIHSQQVFQKSGHMFASCPSTCWQWSTQPEFATDPSKPGYNKILLDSTGDFEITTHRLK
ncbi:metallophosphoesterase family protein [Aliiglaciecola litoralis]|uniref:3',5'-cyclic-AMP phosphodiesterase n=1 Tax=Aliiglaciecola litoralis TaxID=582857 RepID=A0ABN1LET0_9ALTE